MKVEHKLYQILVVLLSFNVFICNGNFKNDQESSKKILVHGSGVNSEEQNSGTIELIDGVYMSYLPEQNNRSTIVNFKMDVPKFKNMIQGGEDGVEGRKKNKKLMKRILPLFILPFLIQSAIVPMFLSTLKMMLIKSLMVGKLALMLLAFNALRTSNAFKSRSEEKIADIHYGYHGGSMEEYGSYLTQL